MRELQRRPDLGVFYLDKTSHRDASSAEIGKVATESGHGLAVRVPLSLHHAAHALRANIATKVLLWLVRRCFGIRD